MNIPQLKEKLSDINRMGYVVSLRKGNTGIGYTLETLLGVAENNLRSPDLGIELKETSLGVAENNFRYSDSGNIELKSRRIKSPSLLTMFTFNDSIWKINSRMCCWLRRRVVNQANRKNFGIKRHIY